MTRGYQDYRAIPVEVLRDFGRTRAEIITIRAAAKEVGIGHSTFHKFILGRTSPQPRVRRLLGLWFISKQNEADDVDIVRPYVSALYVLLAALPEHEQDAARAEALAAFRSIYEGRAPVPRWLELLHTP